jgi:hypothetical protein
MNEIISPIQNYPHLPELGVVSRLRHAKSKALALHINSEI